MCDSYDTWSKTLTFPSAATLKNSNPPSVSPNTDDHNISAKQQNTLFSLYVGEQKWDRTPPVSSVLALDLTSQNPAQETQTSKHPD